MIQFSESSNWSKQRSVHEERNEGVGDISLGELEMVTLDLGECDFLSLVEGLESNQVVLVEVAILKGHNALIFGIEGLEPLRLLGVDHSVLGEHDKHESVECFEVRLFLSNWIGSLVVKEAKEDAVFFIFGELFWVAEISSWSEVVLNNVHVDE